MNLERIFIAAALILTGALLLTRSMFGIVMNIARPVAGIALVYLGLRMLLRTKRRSAYTRSHTFKRSTIVLSREVTNLVITASAVEITLDPTLLELDHPFHMRIVLNVSSAHLVLNAALPTTLKTSAFASTIVFPDGSTSSFGTTVYYGSNDSSARIVIEVRALCSTLTIQQ